MLPAASSIVAVSTRVAPEVRFAVDPVRTMSAAAPCTTSNGRACRSSGRRDVASIVIGPASAPVIVLVATPPDDGRVAGARHRADAGLLGERDHGRVVGGDGVAARVLDRRGQQPVAPEVRSAVEPVSTICAAAPATTLKLPSVPVVRPAAVASIETVPVSAPVIVFVATPPEAVALPVPLTVPVPDALANAIDGRVVGGDGVAGRVLDRRGQQALRAGGEVRSRAGERDLGRCARHDGEGAEGAGGEAGGGRFHRYRAGEGAGDRLGGDAARRRWRCRCRTPCLGRRPWRTRSRSCCRR